MTKMGFYFKTHFRSQLTCCTIIRPSAVVNLVLFPASPHLQLYPSGERSLETSTPGRNTYSKAESVCSLQGGCAVYSVQCSGSVHCSMYSISAVCTVNYTVNNLQVKMYTVQW